MLFFVLLFDVGFAIGFSFVSLQLLFMVILRLRCAVLCVMLRSAVLNYAVA